MKYSALTLFLCFTFLYCQKKETILETEAIALNSVFNSVVDSIYLKLTKNKTIENNLKNKIIVVYDSLHFEKPSYFHLKARFKNVVNTHTDTISDKVQPKINLPFLEKEANFKYKYSLSLKRSESFPADFSNSNYAIPGLLLFSKINFDEKRKYGVFYGTYENGNYLKAKHFLIYIKKVNEKWELDRVDVLYITY